MTLSLMDVAWPITSLGDALLALAQFSRLSHATVQLTGPHSGAGMATWLEAAAQRIGLEADSVAAAYGDVDQLIRQSAPALLVVAHSAPRSQALTGNALPRGSASFAHSAPVPHYSPIGEVACRDQNIVGDRPESPSSVLVVIGASKRQLRVVAPDLSLQSILVSDVRQALCHQAERPHAATVAALLKDIGVSGRGAREAQTALLCQRLVDERIGGVWMLRAPEHGEVRWGRWLTVLIGTHIIEQNCTLAAWTLLGWMTFSGRLDTGWLVAWLLLLVSIVPFRLLTLAAGGRLSLEFGAALRRRLLAGALRLDPDRVRVDGTGGLLGRVLEAETIEQLALGGGMTAALSLIELTMAVGVLGLGAGKWSGAALLIVFVALAAWLAQRNFRARSKWTDARLQLTNDLVERMVGHRTTLAQQPRDVTTTQYDQTLDRYLTPSASLDRSTVVMQVLIPRGWLLAGLLWLGPGFVAGSESVTTLAISLGGLMLARQGLKSLVDGLDRVTGAAVSWYRLRPFLTPSSLPEPVGDPDFSVSQRSATATSGDTLLEGRELLFRHARRSEPLLSGMDVTIRRGDRVLLEGPSGGGKSTLAALLAGSRVPQAGVLLLRGLDQQTLGVAWRRRVVLAPQFHHNHVLMGTFLYNLLLGRAWPPSQPDVEAAERLCRTLDLGPLIDRMPGGLLQMVGETGWQLSHGERSRLFLARALLQGAELVVLDETFAALDPETLSRTLRRVLDLAPTLVVIAHP
jgi:ATP-binding cassette subfamily B protein